MTRYLSICEVLVLHEQLAATFGGSTEVRDFQALQWAVGQPRLSFDGVDIYGSVLLKAAALCFGLVLCRPFQGGNQRTAHAAMEVFLDLNGYQFKCGLAEQVQMFNSLTDGKEPLYSFARWLRRHVKR